MCLLHSTDSGLLKLPNNHLVPIYSIYSLKLTYCVVILVGPNKAAMILGFAFL